MIRALLLVFLGGGIGCVLRFLIGKGIHTFYKQSLPIATLLANFLACLILGITLYLMKEKWNNDIPENIKLLVVLGFCGGLSTFSTFSYETLLLIKQGAIGMAILNVVLKSSSYVFPYCIISYKIMKKRIMFGIILAFLAYIFYLLVRMKKQEPNLNY